MSVPLVEKNKKKKKNNEPVISIFSSQKGLEFPESGVFFKANKCEKRNKTRSMLYISVEISSNFQRGGVGEGSYRKSLP